MTRSMTTALATALSAVAFTFAAGSAQAAINIDFEGTNAPCCFSGTTPLTNYYAAQGVTFAGVGAIGGSILNQSGNFGFSARSGTDFLAFNVPYGTSNIEQISFAQSASNVSIWAANIFGGQVSMQAFDAQNNLLATSSINSSANWTQLSVSANNIASVRLIGAGNYYAYDDLSISAVPESETYALMLGGLALMVWRARRQKTAGTLS